VYFAKIKNASMPDSDAVPGFSANAVTADSEIVDLIPTSKSANEPIKVLGVCTGNKTRSIILHAILEHFKKMGRANIVVDSAGTAAADGNPVSENAEKVLAKHGIELPDSAKFTKGLTPEDIEAFDLLILMGEDHLYAIDDLRVEENLPEVKHHLFLTELLEGSKGLTVYDPTGSKNFEDWERAYSEIYKGAEKLLTCIEEQKLVQRNSETGKLERTRSYAAVRRPFAEAGLEKVLADSEKALSIFQSYSPDDAVGIAQKRFAASARNRELYSNVAAAFGIFETNENWQSDIVTNEEFGLASYPEPYRQRFDHLSKTFEALENQWLQKAIPLLPKYMEDHEIALADLDTQSSKPDQDLTQLKKAIDQVYWNFLRTISNLFDLPIREMSVWESKLIDIPSTPGLSQLSLDLRQKIVRLGIETTQLKDQVAHAAEKQKETIESKRLNNNPASKTLHINNNLQKISAPNGFRM
jgi:protein-tyrosine-phosphatase